MAGTNNRKPPAPSGGPDGYWSTEKEPSRGQMAEIARVALDVLRIKRPTNRLEATVVLARLTETVASQRASSSSGDSGTGF